MIKVLLDKIMDTDSEDCPHNKDLAIYKVLRTLVVNQGSFQRTIHVAVVILLGSQGIACLDIIGFFSRSLA